MKAVRPDADRWKAAFPDDESKLAVDYLVKLWNEVVPLQPSLYAATARENTLTERFYSPLEKQSEAAGLSGFWNYERQFVFADETTGQLVKRIRNDIIYQSNKTTTRLELIFEFKKLKASDQSYAAYRGEDGMLRFVTGFYARGQPEALMVGMVTGDVHECARRVKKSIMQQGSRSDLKMLPDSDGTYVLEPSSRFKGSAQYDTQHYRPPPEGPPHGSILLAHVFLKLP